MNNMKVSISTKVLVGKFNYFKDGSIRPPVHQDPYVIDLDGDGLDEVVFGGLETQPNTPTEFSPITVHIFGWKSGVFQDLSSQWLPNQAGDVMGVGAFEFADFNKDGKTDIFMSAYADMTHDFSPYVLYNHGNFFDKFTLPVIEALQHGSAIGDVNSDGFTDVFATGYLGAPSLYLGSREGLRAVPFSNFAGGSDVVLGDFLGDGTITGVIADYWQAGADTMLVKVRVSSDSSTAFLDELGLLPIPVLEKQTTSTEESHDVRVAAVDFNVDGLLDVLVYSRQNYDGQKWPNTSAIQFLQNNGKGVFTDVTGSKLFGYVTASMIPYAPVVRDLNQDGLVDLFVDGVSWDVARNSASLIMQDSSGQFFDTARTLLSAQVTEDGGVSTVALGPDGNFHLITLSIAKGIGTVHSQLLAFPDRESAELLNGTGLADRINGKGGNDKINGGPGDDHIDGGSGVDTAVFDLNFKDYAVDIQKNNHISVRGNNDADQLVSVERLQFSDKNIALDINTNAGQVAKTLGAVFGKDAVNNKSFVGIGLHFLDERDYSYSDLMQLAINARLGPNRSHDQVVDLLYTNVVGQAPDAAARKTFTDLLDNGTFTVGGLGVLAAETELNKININLVGLAQTGLEFLPFVNS
jgi:hypothetical protein